MTAAVSNIRQTVIQVINQVQRKLGVNTTSTLTETKHATVLLRLLNEVITECEDAGDWLELYEEHTVTAQSSVAQYTIDASAQVHHIHEIHYEGSPAPLANVSISKMRMFGKITSFGSPRHFALTNVDDTTGQPVMKVFPVPTTARTFDIGFYEKQNLLTTSDTATVPKFPANVLIQGVYAKALLDENGGEPTKQFEFAYGEYKNIREQAMNRYTSDTGGDIYMVPQRGYRAR